MKGSGIWLVEKVWERLSLNLTLNTVNLEKLRNIKLLNHDI